MAEEKDTDGSEVQSLIVPQFVRDDVVVPTLASVPASPKPVGWLRKTIRIFGPGPVTGAADDDPSGIATYSSVGAQFGYGILWTMPLIYPFMAAIQEISARTWGQNLLHHPHLHLLSCRRRSLCRRQPTAAGQIKIYANLFCDVVIRSPASFAVSSAVASLTKKTTSKG
jgi:hypothetical protein